MRKIYVLALASCDITSPLAALPMKNGTGAMQSQMKERWRLLCEQAAAEQDPTKLIALCAEIDRLLESEENLRREALGTPRKPETSAG
jgi:hypothetical protein